MVRVRDRKRHEDASDLTRPRSCLWFGGPSALNRLALDEEVLFYMTLIISDTYMKENMKQSAHYVLLICALKKEKNMDSHLILFLPHTQTHIFSSIL